jgi:CarboxypepD_reg-like domain
MKKIIILKALFFLCNSIFTQNINLKGVVLNSQTNQPIIYAVVGLMKENRGVSTDEMGQFELENVNKQDTLLVSCVGFEKQVLSVSEYKEGKIRLMQVAFQLPVLTVKPQLSKNLIVNNFKSQEIKDYMTTKLNDTIAMTQMAQFFENPGEATWFVRELNLVRAKHFPSSENKAKFRLRFYGVDETGKPDGKDICEPILIDNKKNLIQLDITKSNLIIPPKGLFVAVEWIKIKENFIVLNIYKNEKLLKKDYSYKPFIGMTNSKYEMSNVYRLDYRGIWQKNNSYSEKTKFETMEYRKLAISLTLSN